MVSEWKDEGMRLQGKAGEKGYGREEGENSQRHGRVQTEQGQQNELSPE